MVSLNNLKTFYMLYTLIKEKPRYELSYIAEKLGLSGRGRTKATASKYIHRMYDREISFHPNLILKAHENCFTKAFFLKLKKPQETTSAFINLTENPHISYMLLLGGIYDFFVTSRFELKFPKGILIKERSMLFDPIYTCPFGWNLEMRDAYKNVADSTLKIGKLEREIADFLPWDKIHFNIFNIMKQNMQVPFSDVAKKAKISSVTVKRHFLNTILPYCNIAHYFFPKGYNQYRQSLVLIETAFEKDFVKILSKLPCTTYVFPLEKKLAIGVFHEGVNDLMFALKKLEEKGFVKKHLLLTPLSWE